MNKKQYKKTKLLLIINYFFCRIRGEPNNHIQLISYTTTLRVRYGETDQMGVVYHGNYAQYFEIARTEWLRSLGVTYKKMEEDGVMLPVISLQCKYTKSARYDDLLSVTISVKKTPLVKIEFDYVIKNQEDELIATANTVLAFINKDTGKPMKCPEEILKKMTQIKPSRLV